MIVLLPIGPSVGFFRKILVEVTCQCVWIDGEILEKACKKKVGTYDQLIREISEAHANCSLVQSAIVVSATGAFMKKFLADFAKVTKLEGRHLARYGREVVDAAIRGGERFRNYLTDSMVANGSGTESYRTMLHKSHTGRFRI
jgi:hypothetical protein